MLERYFIRVGGERRGPYDRYQLADLGVTLGTPVCRDGEEVWLPAGRVPELCKILPDGQPRYPITGPSRPLEGLQTFAPLPPTGPAGEGPAPPYEADDFLLPNRLVGRWMAWPALALVLLSVGLSGALALWLAGGPRPSPWQRALAEFAHAVAFAWLILSWYASAAYRVLLYRGWALLPGGRDRPPGLVVVVLFVPVVGWFWGFVAYVGLAQALNRFAERHKIEAPRVPEGLAFCFALFRLALPAALLVLLSGAAEMKGPPSGRSRDLLLGAGLFLLAHFANFVLQPLFYASLTRTAAGILLGWRGRQVPRD